MTELESNVRAMGLGAAAMRAVLHEAQVVEVALTDIMVALERRNGDEGALAAAAAAAAEEEEEEATATAMAKARLLGKRVTDMSVTAAELIREDI